MDKCDKSAVKILKDAGIVADEMSGLTEEQLIEIVPKYDGMVVRSATTVTRKILQAATRMTIVGRAGVVCLNVMQVLSIQHHFQLFFFFWCGGHLKFDLLMSMCIVADWVLKPSHAWSCPRMLREVPVIPTPKHKTGNQTQT